MGCGIVRGSSGQVHPDPSISISNATALVPDRPSEVLAETQPKRPPATRSASPPPAAAPPTVAEAELSGPGGEAVASTAPAPAPAPRKPKVTLIKAVKDNKLVLVDELLRDPACPLEMLGMWDNTPLLVACLYGYRDIAMRLIAKKANVSARNEHGATSLHYATVEGALDVVSALLAGLPVGKIDDGDTIIKDDDGMLKMVNCGLAKVYNRHLDSYAMRTPLASAAESGFVDVCSALLTARAEIDAVDDENRGPLWLACRHAKVGVVRFFLQGCEGRPCADANAKDAHGVSVLGAATAGGNEETVLALLTHGSIVDVNDTAGSPLRDAVKSSKRAVVEALLTHGAAVHPQPGPDGKPPSTPLHAACEKGDEYLVSLLVRARADPSLGDAAGLTAFDFLRRRGFSDASTADLLRPPVGCGGDGANDGSTGATGGTDCEE